MNLFGQMILGLLGFLVFIGVLILVYAGFKVLKAIRNKSGIHE